MTSIDYPVKGVLEKEKQGTQRGYGATPHPKKEGGGLSWVFRDRGCFRSLVFFLGWGSVSGVGRRQSEVESTVLGKKGARKPGFRSLGVIGPSRQMPRGARMPPRPAALTRGVAVLIPPKSS